MALPVSPSRFQFSPTYIKPVHSRSLAFPLNFPAGMLRSEEGDRSIVEIAISFLIFYLLAYFQRRLSKVN